MAEPQFSVLLDVPHVWDESARQILPAVNAREQTGMKAGSAQIVQPPRVAEPSEAQKIVSPAAM